MAKRGSKKELSERHENAIAKEYDGQRSPTSGGAVTDQGDVRILADNTLFECKYMGSPDKPLKRQPGILKRFEKIADEAFSEGGREPALALRFYWPQSILADADGWVDLSVRLTSDDAWRSFYGRVERGATCEDDGKRWR